MKTYLLVALTALLSGLAHASVQASGDSHVTITADGANSFLGDVATADDTVVCHFQRCTLTADHLTYDRLTHTIVATGHAKLLTHGDTILGAKITVPDCIAATPRWVAEGGHQQ